MSLSSSSMAFLETLSLSLIYDERSRRIKHCLHLCDDVFSDNIGLSGVHQVLFVQNYEGGRSELSVERIDEETVKEVARVNYRIPSWAFSYLSNAEVSLVAGVNDNDDSPSFWHSLTDLRSEVSVSRQVDAGDFQFTLI